VEQLEAALAGFSGTVVMVSHDRALRKWFAACQQSAGEGNGASATRRWIRYSMDRGVLAPA
jgi:macrolide transport system ATP-binding/permease protein